MCSKVIYLAYIFLHSRLNYILLEGRQTVGREGRQTVGGEGRQTVRQRVGREVRHMLGRTRFAELSRLYRGSAEYRQLA